MIGGIGRQAGKALEASCMGWGGAGAARVLSVLLSVSGCPSCLPRQASVCGRAGTYTRGRARTRTRGQAHARDPRGGRVPFRTLHIAERELL